VGFRVLTALAIAAHFAYLAYVLAGGFLAWRWRRTIWVHALAVAWIVIIVVFRLVCPLTVLEHWSRRAAGEAGPFAGFIDRYVAGVLFPAQYEPVAYAMLLTVVLVSWIGFVVRRRRPAPTSPSMD
jgi:hypothetical protein